jgi:hypothetical protein
VPSLCEEIYNHLHPGQWQWRNLTSGEQTEYGKHISEVLEALDILDYDIVKRPVSTTG